MIDFTACKTYNKSFNGANGNKLSVEYNNERYMLKFPAKPTKKTGISYSNSCISEYISCHIFEMFDIPVQETILGTYNRDGKEKIVVACKDFTYPNYVLQDFGSMKNQIIDSAGGGYGTELSDILDSIEEQQFIDGQEVKTRFWNMFVVDALLGNFDRHNGNWGFLYNNSTDEIKLAPVYDCGSCLLSQIDEETIKLLLSSQQEMNARIYNYPTSAIKINDKRINYFDFLTTTTDRDCLLAIKNINSKLDVSYIVDLINNIPCITSLQKDFYIEYLQERNAKIIEPALRHCLKIDQSISLATEYNTEKENASNIEYDEESFHMSM